MISMTTKWNKVPKYTLITRHELTACFDAENEETERKEERMRLRYTVRERERVRDEETIRMARQS